MRLSVTSLTFLILAELTWAGPIQRSDNVVREAGQQPKRYIVSTRPQIQPIKPRQIGSQPTGSVLPIPATDTVDPNASAAPTPQEQTTTITAPTTFETASFVTSSEVDTFSCDGEPLPFTPGEVTTDAQGQPQPVTPTVQTTNIGGQEVTVVFVTESATFTGATAGFTTLTQSDLGQTTDEATATVTLLSTTTATVVESFASGSTVSPAGAGSIVTDGIVSTTTVTEANAASAAASALSSISSSDAGLGPLGVVFTPGPSSASATSTTDIAATSTSTPPPTNTVAGVSESGFTTTLATSLDSNAPLSVVPITTGVNVAAGVGGGGSTVTVTETVTVSVQ